MGDLRQFIVALLLAALSGCATGQMSVQTQPGRAHIFARNLNEQEARDLGEVPIKVGADELKDRYKLVAPFQLEARLEGYQTEKVILAQVDGADINLSLNLKQETGIPLPEKMNEIVEGLFESQSLARTGRYNDAHARLRKVSEKAPELPAIPELEGDIYYLEKRYQEAYSAYGAALKLNPSNGSIQKMRTLLERVINGSRQPASAGN